MPSPNRQHRMSQTRVRTAARAFAFAITVAIGALAPVSLAVAQGTSADYARADGLWERCQGKVAGDAAIARWSSDHQFWYRLDGLDGRRDFVTVDARTADRTPAFDHAALARSLRARLGGDVDATRLPIKNLHLDGDVLHALVVDDVLRIERNGGRVEPSDSNCFDLAIVAVDVVDRSETTGPDTAILFRNERDTPIHLDWIGFDGSRRRYHTLQPGEAAWQHTFPGHAWVIIDAGARDLGAVVATTDPSIARATADLAPPQPRASEAQQDRAWSANRAYKAFVRDANVWLWRASDRTEFALTTDGAGDNAYTAAFAWSPDGRRLTTMRRTAGDERYIPLIDSAPDDQLQPKLDWVRYLKPGDRIPQSKPVLFDVPRQRAIAIDDALFDNPWACNRVEWALDSSRFYFLYNQRGHQVLRVLAVDADSGDVEAVVNEESDTVLDYASRFYLHYLLESDELLWLSERDGWAHLYLYDLKRGRARQLTKGEWIVRGVERIDLDRRRLLIRAGGVDRAQDPYYIHYCWVDLDGRGKLIDLTPADGTHQIEFSPGGQYIIDRYSRVDLAPVTELRNAETGRLIVELERADASALIATGWQWPERFVAKGRDGETDIHGVIWRPTTFDPDVTYPIIENIYAGPHGAFVPKTFQSYYPQQSLAELGFIVVQIDGMGTNYRSREFNTRSWRNLDDAGFPDRKLWIEAAAKRYPYIDATRVGIYGGSAGGQNAMRALIDHHDLYDVAVSSCGCHDNRMDKIWWNELYMGWPIGPHYERASNAVHAHRMEGDLLLIVGELDRNVDPASTMQVVDALIAANKDFDLLVMPGHGHGCETTPYGTRRSRDFFVRHLLGVEPRAK